MVDPDQSKRPTLTGTGSTANSRQRNTEFLFGETRLDRYLARRIRLANWQFRLEMALPVLFTALLPLLAFLAVGLFGVWPRLPAIIHGLALLVAIILPAVILWRHRQYFRTISANKAERELERRAGLSHTPLQAHRDHLAWHPGNDRETIQLWSEHHIALRQVLKKLPWPAWKIAWIRHDPWLLSVPVALIAFTGMMYAGSDWQQRTLATLTVNLHVTNDAAIAIEGWIDPPDYTGRSPIYLGQQATDNPAERIEVPENSRLVLRLDRSKEAPVLTGPGFTLPFARDDKTFWKLERDVVQGGIMHVMVDQNPIAAWDFDIIIDRTPLIQFAELPRITRRQILRIRYEGRDDYGIENAWLLLRKSNLKRNSEEFTLQPIAWQPASTTDTTSIEETVYRLPISLPAPGAMEINGNAWFDLTDHPWAGEEVDLVLEVTDNGGKTGRSRSLRTLLPQKQFTHVMAKELIELRRLLFQDNNLRDAVADGLANIRHDPAHQDQDFTTRLALALGERRLRGPNADVGNNDAMARLIWQTAVWLEEGAQAKMRQKIAELQKKLRDALDAAAMDEELAALLDELDKTWRKMQADRQRAMADLPDELKAMLEQGDLSANQFQRLMEELRRLNDMGDVEAMKEMLAHLQDLTNMSGNEDGMQNRDSKQLAEILKQMKKLRSLAQDQQDLMDDTLRADQYPGTETRRRHTDELVPEQEALLKELRKIANAIKKIAGGVPESLDRADKAMRAALEDMDAAEPGKALDDQAAAIKALTSGGDSLSTMLTMPSGGGPGSNRQPMDPLGRGGDRVTPQGNRSGSGSNQPIPAERSLRESRQILQELHRRLDDPNRDDREIDYLERLLDRF